jgi:uncharacterized membrane protein (DUF373 family)
MNPAGDDGATRARRLGAWAVRASEMTVVAAAQVLVIAGVLIAALTLYVLFFEGIRENLGSIASVDALQAAVERVFAGVLLLMLGLELVKCLTTFFKDFRFQIEIILIVALIAISRHVMLIDLEHTAGSTLLGVAALVLALAIGYALVRQRNGGTAPPPADH